MVIAAVVDVSPAQGKRLLRELVEHNLLEQMPVRRGSGGPRYRMHDLVRLYARECADAEEPSAERAAAVDRLAGNYLATIRKLDKLLRPYISGRPANRTSQETVPAFRRRRRRAPGCLGAYER